MDRYIFTIAVFIIVSLPHNYTFPLHGMRKKIWPLVGRSNHTKICPREPAVVNVTYSHPAPAGQWGEATVTIEKLMPQGADADHAISSYDHMVIMKKYPFLDLKDLYTKVNPFYKRASRKLLVPWSFRGDQGLCDADEGLNVEISNRGLSGFSLPTPIETKLQLSTFNLIKQ